MVWGGRKLARFLGKNLPPGESVGESWEVSDHPLHASVLATAIGHGNTLRQLMTHDRARLLGPAARRYDRFPWLIKLLDARDWLSVQVHPDEVAVKKLLPGESAKTEAWYILDAEPTSRIYAGLKPGIGPSELRSALARGHVQDCLHAFTPRPGDFLYLPAGTVHAVGGGVLFAEIQQTSDATLRLFDWNRRDAQGKARALHIDESFAAIHWDQGPVAPIAETAEAHQPLIRSRYFEVDRIRKQDDLEVGDVGRLQALIVTAGQGRFPNGEFCMAGDVWLFPAALPRIRLHLDAPLTGLLCTLPDEGTT